MGNRQESDKAHEPSMPYKRLRLVSPENAREIGIPTENPVFVSPYVEAESCSCGVKPASLAYRVGEKTQAQHFHQQGALSSGGIFYFRNQNYREGWIGEVEPLGIQPAIPALYMGIAESVLTTQIRAFCISHPEKEELNEGMVIAKINPEYGRLDLLPVCYDSGFGNSEYQFSIVDGSLRFLKN